MTPMTDRGLPIVDGAPACPFVAFEDDRDARATSPDHRHRCYAEVRPAPRALAHQEAYCLSSAFPVCPTFQDWARREAAKATAAAEAIPPAMIPEADPGPDATDHSLEPGSSGDMPQRNPPREWSAPPPWLGPERERDDDDEREVGPLPARGGGLSGSFADRLAGASLPVPPPVPPPVLPITPPEAPAVPAWRDQGRVRIPDPASGYAAPADDEEAADAPLVRELSRRVATGPRGPERDRTVDQAGPVWERPRRREAYPTLKTRMGLGGLSLPPIMLGLVAVVMAAVALFFLPTLIGLIATPHVGGSPSASPGSSTAAASATPLVPTEVPAPTQQIYVVQSGDTMSRIARRFGVPLQTLIDANKATIPNPDRVKIGDTVIIPVTTPTSLPGVGASASP